MSVTSEPTMAQLESSDVFNQTFQQMKTYQCVFGFCPVPEKTYDNLTLFCTVQLINRDELN